jgi:hypothetical protein
MYLPDCIHVSAVLPLSSSFCKRTQRIHYRFFKLVQANKITEAFDHLFVGSQIPAQKPQAVDALKRQTASGLPMYGNVLGVELFREEKIGDSIVRLVYILKMEMAPMIWEFYFYKPKKEWFLANIIFNDEFHLLESLK